MGRDRAARAEATPLRLFAAVDPPPRVVEALDHALRPWRERLPRGRWVRPENWHVTVRFLGRTWPRLVPFVREACAAAAGRVRPFGASVGHLGVFPSPGSARVLWVAVEDDEGGLPALASALEEALAPEFPPEKRGFTPHLTVARFDPPVPVRHAAEDLAAFRADAGRFRVGHLVLYRSHLSPRGARYEALASFPLGG